MPASYSRREMDAVFAPLVAEALPCFAQHAAMKLDPKVWASLDYVGSMPTEDDDGKPLKLELRNCKTCHSTLAVEVRP